jgi:hypothetical protein
MALRTMGLSGFLVTPLSDAILHVVRIIPKIKMVRINTKGFIAGMKYHHPLGYLAPE